MANKQNKAYVKNYYKIEGDKIIRIKRICPKCRVYMADHKDRYHCGSCGFTEFKAK